jgi:diadenosine tetraphosphate (Ap4A) HIT family hydrolase
VRNQTPSEPLDIAILAMTDPFILDPRLAGDTLPLTAFDLCLVRLMNDRQYPWLILVPRRPGLSEIHDLAEADRALLMAEIVRATRALERLYRPVKLNVAALGNAVPQLHVHIIARSTRDAAWPRPIWGVTPAVPYRDDEREGILERLGAAFKEPERCV